MRKQIENIILSLYKDLPSFEGQLKKKVEVINLEGLSIDDLKQHIEDNNIESGWFSVKDNDDFFGTAEPLYCWNTQVPLTKEDKELKRKKYFNNNLFKKVQSYLIDNGYSRKSASLEKRKLLVNYSYYDTPIDCLIDYMEDNFYKKVIEKR